MAEPFKNLISTRTVDTAGRHLQRVWPRFNRAAFEQQAASGLDALEFKARAMQLADALEATLPDRFAHAADLIEASLAPPTALDAEGEPVGLANNEHGEADEPGLRGWVVWSLAEFVARRGMGDLPRALACLHALTQRFSSEFAIRPFIQRHPDAVFATLAQWVHDPSAHVRRLVSEGSRPRLPWGLRLQALVADPAPTLPLLRALQDDPSAYVRRSVANHLNDIGKDHPQLLVGWVMQHRDDAHATRNRLLRHASRHLIKQGHTGMLDCWGVGSEFVGEAVLSVPRRTVRIGEALPLTVTLTAGGQAPQNLEVDVRAHYRKADGQLRPKVFKGQRLTLAPGEQFSWTQAVSFKPVSTRALHPGPQGIDVAVNGRPMGWVDVTLKAPTAGI